MGRTVTPTYRMEYWDQGGHHQQAWSGRPTNANLAKYIRAHIKSLKKGGVNYHVSLALKYIPVPHKARIVRQKTGDVVATWKAPSFMVI